ncbi:MULTISPECIES: NAD(P)/FAD-dependent oxidoreductase [unclassified Streptomyces]|uniref:flavin-containing monooxygenase n=1 Tax=unclassified Streptomyces TaxID=2593676 RepID=UPI000DBA25E8|nr:MULTISPECIES: NAD(P)/FAD-dependent oxidoreductase [unclassified Streptomyces]MYT73562.1 FAD-dependent oxidoreductase [Streptomyces sp. SID8367]RAJ85099.1 cation diffusion facilitator CzcD-associated flavoprotein CzcO [Streptomyces sp. PsTaAH-137]
MEQQHVDVLVIGAGISGISAARHVLRDNPAASLVVLERRARVGGTWDLFQYPGIRSDSDMSTFGFGFRPWRDARILAGGAQIRQYVEDAAADDGVLERIRFGRRAISADFSHDTGRWTVEVEDEGTGEHESYSAGYLVGATGYYDYDQPYRPEFPGEADYQGTLVHPQQWPEGLDHTGKRVVVIGSGATAITLLPAMADTAAHVTMLQRSPTYVLALPEVDPLTSVLQKLRAPARLTYKLVRARNIALQRGSYAFCRKYPRLARKVLLGLVRAQAGKNVDMRHFSPNYKPWDQRLCVVPGGDLFKTLKSGRASIATDHIDTFTADGIRLKSGEELKADIVITATGLSVRLMGGMALTVDGSPVDVKNRVLYKAVLLEGVPNMSLVIGYTNASWTLKADLAAAYTARLLAHMRRHGHDIATPVASARDRSEFSVMGEALTSGYIARANEVMPRQGTRDPWRLWNNYYRDRALLQNAPIDDSPLRFDKAGTPDTAGADAQEASRAA